MLCGFPLLAGFLRCEAALLQGDDELGRAQDILPREVLEDDGSREDRQDANKARSDPNYSDAHWYKTGEGSDPHGDLQELNRERQQKEMRKIRHQDEVDAEREHALEARREAALRARRAAAMQELQERRKAGAGAGAGAGAHARWRHTSAPSYREMQKQLAREDAARQAAILKHSGLHSRGGSHAAQRFRQGHGAAGGEALSNSDS